MSSEMGTFSCIKESSDLDSNYSFEFKHFFGFCDFSPNLYIEFCDFSPNLYIEFCDFYS